MISMVEFFYYFTFKLFQNFDDKREKFTGSKTRRIVSTNPKMSMDKNGVNIKTNIQTVHINVSDQFYSNYAKRHGSYLH